MTTSSTKAVSRSRIQQMSIYLWCIISLTTRSSHQFCTVSTHLLAKSASQCFALLCQCNWNTNLEISLCWGTHLNPRPEHHTQHSFLLNTLVHRYELSQKINIKCLQHLSFWTDLCLNGKEWDGQADSRRYTNCHKNDVCAVETETRQH